MSPPSTRADVLVVEDEQSTADAYARVLDDYDVRVATSGAEALEALDPAIDVIVLDRRMPGLSGADVLAEIANRAIDVRVAMVTAVEPDFDILEFDIDAYLRKPVDVDCLESTVGALAELDRYEELKRDLGSARVKLNVLDVEKDTAELETNDQYRRLESQIETLETEIATIEQAYPLYFSGEARPSAEQTASR